MKSLLNIQCYNLQTTVHSLLNIQCYNPQTIVHSLLNIQCYNLQTILHSLLNTQCYNLQTIVYSWSHCWISSVTICKPLYIHEVTVEYPVLQFANHCIFMKSLLNTQCYNLQTVVYSWSHCWISSVAICKPLYIHEVTVEYPVLKFANHCIFMKSLLNIQCYNLQTVVYSWSHCWISSVTICKPLYILEVTVEYPVSQFCKIFQIKAISY